jgi:hypothetical protein
MCVDSLPVGSSARAQSRSGHMACSVRAGGLLGVCVAFLQAGARGRMVGCELGLAGMKLYVGVASLTGVKF